MEIKAYEAIAAVLLSLYVVASVFPRSTGLDMEYRFGVSQIGPWGWLILLVLCVSSSTILAWYRAGGVERLSARLKGVGARVLVSLTSGALFFAFRTRFINEDGLAFARKFAEDIPIRGAHVTHDEIFELWVHSKFWVLTNASFGWSVEQSYAVLSCLAGTVFVFLLLKYCEELFAGRAAWAFALCLSGGYAQLFFGDVENYTLTAAWCLGYLLAALLFLKRRQSVVPASVLLAIAMTFHLEAAIFVPSWLYLLHTSWRRDRRARPIAVACVLFVSIGAGTLWFFHLHGLPITALFQDSHALGHGGHFNEVLVKPSREYYGKILNLTFLLVPAWVLLIPLAVCRRIRLDPVNVHLLLAAACGGLLLVSWKARLGVYNDWNLFANVAVPVSLLVWRNVLEADEVMTRPGPIMALHALFLVHSYSWIVGNHYL